MKTSKVVYLGFFLILLLQGCMPDSFTKFKEEPVKKTAEAAAPEAVPTGFDGSTLDFSKITLPTSWGYSGTPGDITTQTLITEVGVDMEDNGFINGSPCDGRPIVPGSFSPICYPSTEREDHDREIIEGLKLRFYEAGITPPAGAPPTCFNSGAAGTNLPPGLLVNEFDGTIVGIPLAMKSDTVPGPNYGLPYSVWIVAEFTNASLVREVLCTQIKIASYKVPNANDFRFQQNSTLKLKLTDFVGQGSIAAFSAGDPISTVDPDGPGPLAIATGNVIFVDEVKLEIIIQRTAGEFFQGSKIDDAPSYLGPEATVSNVVNVFQAGGVINVGPVGLPPMIASPGPYINETLGPENGVRFLTDFDPLPPSLTFSALTGLFNGTLNSEIVESPVKVYAVNPLWENNGFDFTDVLSGAVTHSTVTGDYNPVSRAAASASVSQTDVAETVSNFQVINPARDAALTEQSILYLSDVSAFSVGDYVSAATTCSGSTSVGRVVHVKANNPAPLFNYILIQHLQGCSFKIGDNLDATFPYKSPKATVYDAVANSVIIQATDASLAGWATGHISGANGAKGWVNEIDNIGGASSYLLVKVTSPVDIAGDIDSTTDNEQDAYFSTVNDALAVGGRSNAIGNCELFAGCALTSTINNIFAGNITLDPDSADGDAVNLVSGATISNSTNDGFGEIIFNEGAEVKHIQLTTGFLRAGAAVSATNPYAGGSTIATDGYTYIPTFYLQKDKYYEIKMDMTTGDTGASYQLDPVTLPTGLSLQADGSIVGNPTQSQPRTVYKLTAANGSGTTTYKFRLQVLDAVELVVSGFATSAQNSSVIMHKSGRGNQLKGCRITKDQMINGVENNIVCYLDAG
ncbi:MAG: putative Ig domain-containing protein, partial [Bacteriovoracaceae bacterium]|nr:putative Ig domain-containing protein [Bacteriovoracaceae bacterium]